MQIGRLYFFNKKQDKEKSVNEILAAYIKKEGSPPNTILFNPEEPITEIKNFDGVLAGYRPVLPSHLWLGNDEETKKG